MTTRAMWFCNDYLRTNPSGPRTGASEQFRPRWVKCAKEFRCECFPYTRGQPQVRCQNVVKVGELYFNTGKGHAQTDRGMWTKVPVGAGNPPGKICFHCANEELQHVDAWLAQSRRPR